MREGTKILNQYSMENQQFSPPHSDESRPSLGFPLGTALLLIIVFSLSGIFSCCYHWDKLRSFRTSFSDDPNPETDIEQPPTKSNPTCMDFKQNQRQSLPVLMPGDEVPKFIALSCPFDPPRVDKFEIKVPKSPIMTPPMPVPLD